MKERHHRALTRMVSNIMNSFWNNMRILGFCGCARSNCPILLVPGWLNLSLQSMGSSIHKRVPMTVMAGRGWGKSTMILLWPTASDWEFSMSCVFGHKLRFLYSHFTFIHVPTLYLICPHMIFCWRKCWFTNQVVPQVTSETAHPTSRPAPQHGQQGETEGWGRPLQDSHSRELTSMACLGQPEDK